MAYKSGNLHRERTRLAPNRQEFADHLVRRQVQILGAGAWAAEATGYPNHVVEQALAHTISSAVEAAYRRGDLFEKRRVLMDDWAAYLAQQAAEVVPLRHSKRAL